MPPQKLAGQVEGQLSQRTEQMILYSDRNQARLQTFTSDETKTSGFPLLKGTVFIHCICRLMFLILCFFLPHRDPPLLQ